MHLNYTHNGKYDIGNKSNRVIIITLCVHMCVCVCCLRNETAAEGKVSVMLIEQVIMQIHAVVSYTTCPGIVLQGDAAIKANQ